MNQPNQQKPKPMPKYWLTVFILLIMLAIYQIPLPYYYSQPGDALALDQFIEVEGMEEQEGDFYLTTIQQQRANPFLYVWSQFSDYRTLTHEDALLQEGETDEDYQHRQTMLMTSSQEASKLSAYEAAGLEVDMEPLGILVTQVVEGMDGANYLENGDYIRAIDEVEIETLEQLHAQLEGKEEGDEVQLTIERDGERFDEIVQMEPFPGEMATDGQVGLGIQYPVADREVSFDPSVDIDAGAIGGPSAGLMFSLEIYDQVTEQDLTGDLNIAGTGSIDEGGNVGRIGGVSQKVVAADQAGIDIFFTPADEDEEGSNYLEAAEAAENIDTAMEIVPVETLQEAIDYLNEHRGS
ncbi:SepM family pheromone-processing serine protease [Salsuginibacillus kocurii]|uniref:SepM family pheromone-processing serine protease n=1 Tax=Salsuginibacillus kocurii TaxID=427078 RepID=UPI000362C0FF|nr:SepM family pheromone-processing serine protease [Salsuginibacillus kocurii]